MKVLVTGGTGSVGINIVRVLADAGHDVLCLSRRAAEPDTMLERFLAPVANRVKLVAADVGDPASLETVWDEHEPTHVVHAAAITPTPEMERQMTTTILQANLMGTIQMLEAARRKGVRRFIYISSGAVYGVTDESEAIDETTSTKPWGLYAISKDASEKLCAYHRHLHGLDSIVLRVGWVYGPMERPMTGSRLTVSLACQCVRMALAGEQIRLVHLDHVRDWIHTDDLGRAVLEVLQRDSLSSTVFNVAGPQGYTHRALLAALGQTVPVRYQQVDEREANIPATVTRERRGPLAIRRLMAETGYRPRYTLEEGLRQYVTWTRSAG